MSQSYVKPMLMSHTLLSADPMLFLCQDYVFWIENAMFSLVKRNLLKSYAVFKGRNKGRNDIVST